MKKSYLAPQISELGKVMTLTQWGWGKGWGWGSWGWGSWGWGKGSNNCNNPCKPGGDSC